MTATSGMAQTGPDETVAPLSGSTQDRTIADASRYPWSAIGRVNVPGVSQRSHCTGALIGERLAVTAAHCFYDRRTQHWARPDNVYFVAGYQRGEFVAFSKAERLVASPDFNGAKWTHPDNYAHDWALIVLKEPLGLQAGYLGLFAVNDAWVSRLRDTPDAMVLAGYPRDRAHAISLTSGCGVTGATSDRALLMHGCTIQNGDSGAPLAIRLQDGGLAAIAVNSASGVRTSRGLVNTAVPIAALLPQIQALLKETEGLDALDAPGLRYGAPPAPAD